VARPDNNPNSQALPQFGQNAKETYERAAKRSLVNKVTAQVTIRVELANPPLPTIKKHYDIFIAVYKLLDTIHMDQTGAFPITSKQSYWNIMVGIHLDVNYIFCESMKNRTEGKMITASTKEW
jgi:hypothetical protein